MVSHAQNSKQNTLLTLLGVLLIFGGVVHWLIIFGVLHENAPLCITYYFHSLAVIDIAAGVGLIMRKRWGGVLGIFIGVTQIPAHAYMLYLDSAHTYGSGISTLERLVDIGFSVVLILAMLHFLRRKK